MNYQIRPLTLNPDQLSGLSNRLITSHHENNYSGAVKRLNAIRSELAALDWSTAATFTINGLKREELIAANSAFLHELYFDNLGGNGVLPSCGLSIALTRDFGSVDAWRSQFTGLAKAMGGGSGWALLSWSSRESRLINHWAADHTHLLAGATPVLALMKWVTRERPKIDRIACPWLIARFIDKEPEFLYVPSASVLQVAKDTGAIPYDVPGVEMTHDGDLCSFDAFLKKYELTDPALQQLAVIVRGADTSRLDLAPQSSGLYALSLGLSKTFSDDHEMLRHGMVMYDALYAWCKSCQAETHNWPPSVAA
jgi:superoxide dismutase